MYVSNDIIKDLQKIDLLTYLRNYEPNELIHISGNTYATKSHDSLKISNGLWNWFSKGIGGKNAIDYLIKVRGYTFLEAADILMSKTKMMPISECNYEDDKHKSKMIIPVKSNDFSIAKEYLINRGIAENIVNECYQNGNIYQEKNTNNVVFVGYDSDGNIKYAGVRGTNETRYMKDATGSNKLYSFRMIPNEYKNNTIHVFESAIDLLSYATILLYKGIDYKKENLVSLAGVYQPAKILSQSKVPVAIKSFLDEHKYVTNIVLHLDNDVAGRNATKAIEMVTPKEYKVIDNPVPIGKDVNDYLCYKLGLKKTKIREEKEI